MACNPDVKEIWYSLPEVIHDGYILAFSAWDDDNAILNRCTMSLDDGEADIQVLRFCIWGECENGYWDALYDIHTFEYIMCIRNSEDTDFKNDDMVEAMKHSIEYI